MGLGALHASKVVHCDVKPGNVVVDAQGYAQLADFGKQHFSPSSFSLSSSCCNDEARRAVPVVWHTPAVAHAPHREPPTRAPHTGLAKRTNKHGLVSGSAGTKPYMSPEIFSERRRGASADMFALGVTVGVMLTGQSPGHVKRAAAHCEERQRQSSISEKARHATSCRVMQRYRLLRMPIRCSLRDD